MGKFYTILNLLCNKAFAAMLKFGLLEKLEKIHYHGKILKLHLRWKLS